MIFHLFSFITERNKGKLIWNALKNRTGYGNAYSYENINGKKQYLIFNSNYPKTLIFILKDLRVIVENLENTEEYRIKINSNLIT